MNKRIIAVILSAAIAATMAASVFAASPKADTTPVAASTTSDAGTPVDDDPNWSDPDALEYKLVPNGIFAAVGTGYDDAGKQVPANKDNTEVWLKKNGDYLFNYHVHHNDGGYSNAVRVSTYFKNIAADEIPVVYQIINGKAFKLPSAMTEDGQFVCFSSMYTGGKAIYRFTTEKLGPAHTTRQVISTATGTATYVNQAIPSRTPAL